MTSAHAFLEAIVENPDDDTTRLVCADWLDDHGDTDRAEHIRAQVELSRLADNDPRREALLKRARALEKTHRREWLRPLYEALDDPQCKQLGKDTTFRRGFLEKLCITPRRRSFLAAANNFLRLQPVQELVLTGNSAGKHADSVEEVAQATCLGGLRFLSLVADSPLTAEALARLGSSPHLPRLRGLCLPLDSAEILAGLAGTPLAGRLETLWLSLHPVEAPAVVRLLTDAPRFAALRHLWLRLDDDQMEALVNSPHLPALERLNIPGQIHLGTRGVTSLVRSPLWRRLTDLALATAHGDVAVRPAIQALPQSRLRRLSLAMGGLTTATVTALAGLPSWGQLQELSLAGNHLGDAGIVALASVPHLAQLRRLDIAHCHVGLAGAQALAASPYAANLEKVQAHEYWMDSQARRVLRKRFGAGFRFER
jgi:uncharacterized protein (TIGR02996 family)